MRGNKINKKGLTTVVGGDLAKLRVGLFNIVCRFRTGSIFSNVICTVEKRSGIFFNGQKFKSSALNADGNKSC